MSLQYDFHMGINTPKRLYNTQEPLGVEASTGLSDWTYDNLR